MQEVPQEKVGAHCCQVVPGTEYKLQQAPKVDLQKVEHEWAGIVRGQPDTAASDDLEMQDFEEDDLNLL